VRLVIACASITQLPPRRRRRSTDPTRFELVEKSRLVAIAPTVDWRPNSRTTRPTAVAAIAPLASLPRGACSPGARSSITSAATFHFPTRPVSRAPRRGSARRREKNRASGVRK